MSVLGGFNTEYIQATRLTGRLHDEGRANQTERPVRNTRQLA
jgi:hypothetical protein